MTLKPGDLVTYDDETYTVTKSPGSDVLLRLQPLSGEDCYTLGVNVLEDDVHPVRLGSTGVATVQVRDESDANSNWLRIMHGDTPTAATFSGDLADEVTWDAPRLPTTPGSVVTYRVHSHGQRFTALLLDGGRWVNEAGMHPSLGQSDYDVTVVHDAGASR